MLLLMRGSWSAFAFLGAATVVSSCLGSTYDVRSDVVADAGGESGSQQKSDAGSSGAYATAVLSDFPSAYYRLTETGGFVVHDETSLHNDATLTAVNCGFHRPGPLTKEASSAMAFDGKSCQLAVPRSVGFPAHSPYSLEAWTQTQTMTQVNAVFGERNATDGFGLFLGTNDLPTFLVVSRTVGGIAVVAATPLPSALNFHHVVSTYDGAALTLYLDGAVQAVKNDSGKFRGDGSGIFIGSSGGADFFGGTLAEVAIYPVALPADRVLAHFKAGSGG
jgi:hypothetical protein